MSTQLVYRVTFTENNTIKKIFSKFISEDNLESFIELDDLIFDSVLNDTACHQEVLKSEFKGVQRLYLPLHTILRIDEIHLDSKGQLKISDSAKSNVSPFPQ
jgi:hypothetical protein